MVKSVRRQEKNRNDLLRGGDNGEKERKISLELNMVNKSMSGRSLHKYCTIMCMNILFPLSPHGIEKRARIIEKYSFIFTAL